MTPKYDDDEIKALFARAPYAEVKGFAIVGGFMTLIMEVEAPVYPVRVRFK